jgi:hypothetical protein
VAVAAEELEFEAAEILTGGHPLQDLGQMRWIRKELGEGMADKPGLIVAESQ